MSERKLENPSDEPLGSVDVSELIAARAHEIFQSRGGEHGRDLDDWLQAEQEVRSSLSGETLVSPAAISSSRQERARQQACLRVNSRRLSQVLAAARRGDGQRRPL